MLPTDRRHNRLRQLKGLVTIDAWHERKRGTLDVSLFAYANFEEARLGGEAGDEVAFRLTLKRAELRFIQSEPKSYDFDPARIWRGDDATVGTVMKKNHGITKENSKVAGSLSLSAKSGFSTKIECEAGGNAEEASYSEFTASGSLRTVAVSFQRNSPGEPVWLFKPMADSPQVHGSSILQGVPWDEAVKMLARMKVDARHLAEEMESQIRLAIVCKREDLVFSDIMIKLADGQFVNMSEGSPKRLIVQEYLKQSLVSADLPSADMMSPFAVIWLGEAISEPRSDNG